MMVLIGDGDQRFTPLGYKVVSALLAPVSLVERFNHSYSGKPDPCFSVFQLNFMSDVSICRRKRNKFNERDTLKIFISYGDSLLLSGKSLHSFCGSFSCDWGRLYKRCEKIWRYWKCKSIFQLVKPLPFLQLLSEGFFPQRLIESRDQNNNFCSYSHFIAELSF